MTVYKSLEMTAPKYPVSGPGIGGRNIHAGRGEFALTAALAANDTVTMFRLMPNFRVTGGLLKSDDLDTNGTPTITLSLGDAGDDDRYFSVATVAQTGTFTSTLAFTGVDFVTTAYTDVILKVNTGPATGATTGTIVAALYGYICEPK